MVDLSQNLIIAIVVGPAAAVAVGMVGWFVRRTFLKQDRDIERQDREIEKMALGQKEFDKKLLDVLVLQSQFDQKLHAGFKQIGSDVDNMKSTFKESFDRIGSDMDGMKASISGLETELREHRAVMDKEIALIRERIGRNGAG